MAATFRLRAPLDIFKDMHRLSQFRLTLVGLPVDGPACLPALIGRSCTFPGRRKAVTSRSSPTCRADKVGHLALVEDVLEQVSRPGLLPARQIGQFSADSTWTASVLP